MPIDGGLAAAVLDSLPDATAVLDTSGTIIAINHTWLMFALDNGGAEQATGVGVNYLDVCVRSAEAGCDDGAEVATQIREVLTGTAVEAELEYPCPSPDVRRWFMMRVTSLQGPAPGAIISHVNITRRKMAEQELAHAASHDPLSGLANRTLLNARLATALAGRNDHRQNADIGLLYIDLDDFKSVNDRFGHAAGDEVLLNVTNRLKAIVRSGGTIARLGGDEFAVIIPRVDRRELTAFAGRVEDALAPPHRIHGELVAVGGSVGVHLAMPGDHAAEALRLADQAMYAAKQGRVRSGPGPSVHPRDDRVAEPAPASHRSATPR